MMPGHSIVDCSCGGYEEGKVDCEGVVVVAMKRIGSNRKLKIKKKIQRQTLTWKCSGVRQQEQWWF